AGLSCTLAAGWSDACTLPDTEPAGAPGFCEDGGAYVVDGCMLLFKETGVKCNLLALSIGSFERNLKAGALGRAKGGSAGRRPVLPYVRFRDQQGERIGHDLHAGRNVSRIFAIHLNIDAAGRASPPRHTPGPRPPQGSPHRRSGSAKCPARPPPYARPPAPGKSESGTTCALRTAPLRTDRLAS